MLFDSIGEVWISSLALAGEGDGVLDTAAALEDIRVIGVGITLADDIGAAQLELVGDRGGTAPLDVLGPVGGALVGAAHHVDVDMAAQIRVGDALELGGGRHTAVCGLCAVAAEGEGLHVGEEDGILGFGR